MRSPVTVTVENGIALKASDIDVTMVNVFGIPRFRGRPIFATGYRD